MAKNYFYSKNELKLVYGVNFYTYFDKYGLIYYSGHSEVQFPNAYDYDRFCKCLIEKLWIISDIIYTLYET